MAASMRRRSARRKDACRRSLAKPVVRRFRRGVGHVSAAQGLGHALPRRCIVVKDVVLMLGLAFGPVSILLGTLWVLAIRRAQRAETMLDRMMLSQQIRGETKGDPTSRVMDALDSLAIEVERISEAQ